MYVFIGLSLKQFYSWLVQGVGDHCVLMIFGSFVLDKWLWTFATDNDQAAVGRSWKKQMRLFRSAGSWPDSASENYTRTHAYPHTYIHKFQSLRLFMPVTHIQCQLNSPQTHSPAPQGQSFHFKASLVIRAVKQTFKMKTFFHLLPNPHREITRSAWVLPRQSHQVTGLPVFWWTADGLA